MKALVDVITAGVITLVDVITLADVITPFDVITLADMITLANVITSFERENFLIFEIVFGLWLY